MISARLVQKFPIITEQIETSELLVLLTELENVLRNKIRGAVVEFGCYAGTTSLFLQRLLSELQEERELHVYDSFQGLPEKSPNDMSPAGLQFKTGELAASKATFIRNFKKTGLPVPKIHKCWFDMLQATDIPEHIAFAFLDGDYYESILTSLGLIWPRLCPGSAVIIDDYHNQALPGAAKAVDQWLQGHPVLRQRAQASLMILQL